MKKLILSIALALSPTAPVQAQTRPQFCSSIEGVFAPGGLHLILSAETLTILAEFYIGYC